MRRLFVGGPGASVSTVITTRILSENMLSLCRRAAFRPRHCVRTAMSMPPRQKHRGLTRASLNPPIRRAMAKHPQKQSIHFGLIPRSRVHSAGHEEKKRRQHCVGEFALRRGDAVTTTTSLGWQAPRPARGQTARPNATRNEHPGGGVRGVVGGL
jgi:hypothetical protein